MFRIVLVIACLLMTTLLHAQEITDEDCLDCHGISGYAIPIGKHGDSKKRHLDLNVTAMRESVHGKIACLDCHADVKKSPHKREPLKAVDCITCHEQLAQKSTSKKNRFSRRKAKQKVVINTKNFADSVHSRQKKDKPNADCATCHTAHYVYLSNDPRALSYRENSPKVCGKCHQKSLREYKKSIHGAFLSRPWKGDSATCSDCHSSHNIFKSKALSTHRILTENCGDCHLDEVNSYMSTTHGQLAWLGNKDVPRCIDCHRGHDTQKVDNAQSMVSTKNILKTCRECHEDAAESIVQYQSHGSTSNFSKYPLMWIAGKILILVVVLVLLFFYAHSMLWFYREYHEREVRWKTFGLVSTKFREKKHKHTSDLNFERFDWRWRVNHWVLALSVMTLVFTGMAVLYPDTQWSMTVIKMSGGPATFGLVHRIVGVIFILTITIHIVAVLSKLIIKEKFDWFGPDSLLPRKKDWLDMKQQFRWFFNKGEQAQFDRWTYWEKFDYWAVYWGAFVIGTSGLVLWYSDTLVNILPGWIFNLASLAHGLEAFLAVMTLFVVHFFNNHFRPAKFPLDTVMFTGKWDLEELKEERPLHYQRLKESGELEKRLVKPPTKTTNIITHIIGFTLLGVGLLLLILVMIGFSLRGFV